MMNHEAVVNDIKAMLERAKAPVIKECCIYRVPPLVRAVKEDAYTPNVVSIGPFHHNGHPGLKNTETLKLSYCNSFLERTQTSLDSWIRYIKDVEPNFRNCYSDILEFSKEELTKIIFVDSAFIFELFFVSYYGGRKSSKDDWLLSKPCLSVTVMKDFLLLENQLPFFILEHLFNLSCPSRSDGIPSLLQLTFRYFNNLNRSKLEVNDIVSIRHFTDLIRTFHLQHPPQKRPPRTSTLTKYLPSATELSEAGVIFKVKTQSTSLLDLTFSGQIFKIPHLVVHDQTESLFRNIVALEQYHYPFESYITDYFHVLDLLVHTGKDVDILVHKGVLSNWLRDTDSVANFFNGMMKNITCSNFNNEYSHLCRELKAFYKNPWNNQKSTLKRDYFNTPWQTKAMVSGAILLILTVVQTVCSILQVRQQ